MQKIRYVMTILLVAALLCCTCITLALSAEVTFLQQLESAAEGELLTLQEDITADVTVDKTLTVDLNGFDMLGAVTVADGCTLYVQDSQTDDYTTLDAEGYGKIAAGNGAVVAADGYMAVTEEDGMSFHRVEMELTSMTLRPERAGLYYNGCFRGDEVVAENVKWFGIALRIEQAPDADYLKTTDAYTWFKDFAAGADGNTATGSLLANVMDTDNTAAVNDAQAKLKICGAAYIMTVDGQYLFGEAVSRSLIQQVQAVDAMWSSLTVAQRTAYKEMYATYSSVMENWYLPNLHNTDIDVPL